MDEQRILSIVNKHSIQKINWYVEYPHKDQWKFDFHPSDFSHALKSLFSSPSALLYLHMPYCHTQCNFCNCKTIISLDYGKVKSYLEFLMRELDLYSNFCTNNGITSNIREIHMGGGSPTYINEDHFAELKAKIESLVNFKNLNEYSIEIDPRRIGPERMLFYKSMGINRLSFGIQDFDPIVQKAINRIQPDSLIKRLLIPEIRNLFGKGINFDIMCGLPEQTRETFKRTIDKVLEFSPDRVSLLSMGLVPKFSPHQLLMPLNKIPNYYQTKLMFADAMSALRENGYIRTGYEHFAKPQDEVVSARNQKTMGWNGLGCTPGRYLSVLGLGISALSTFDSGYYAQNIYELDNWKDRLSKNSFPTYRFYGLTPDDILRRHIIQTLRTYFCLNLNDLNREFNIEFDQYFSNEISRLRLFAEDGMVELNDSSIQITEFGTLFTDVIAGIFDAYVKN